MGCRESKHAVATENTIAKKPKDVEEKVPENVSNDHENGTAIAVQQTEEKKVKEAIIKNEEIKVVEKETNQDVVSKEDLKEGDDKGPVQETTTEAREALVEPPAEKEEPVVPLVEPEEAKKENEEEKVAAVSSLEPEAVKDNEDEKAVVVPSPEPKETKKDNEEEKTADVSALEPEDTINVQKEEKVAVALPPEHEEMIKEEEGEQAAVVPPPEPEASATESAIEQVNNPATNQESVIDSAAEEAKTN